MRFQFSKAPVYGLMLSLCSLQVFADDQDAQGSDLGTAIGTMLGGYIKRAITPTNNNVENSTQSDATVSPTQSQSIHTAPLSPEDQAYLAKGLWHDPNTGLIWSLCRVGETWNGSSCDGKPTQLNWPKAIIAARDSRLDGHTDWRVPSFSEYAGIIRCPTGFNDYRGLDRTLKDAGNDTNDIAIRSCKSIPDHGSYVHILPENFSFKSAIYGRNYDIIKAEFTEWTSTYTLDMSKTHFYPMSTQGAGMPETTDPDLTTRLVRGGSSTSSYQQALRLATNYLKIPMLQAKAIKDRQEDIARRTALLRNNVREGDKTAQGLVIEVKGSLVKLQTYNSVCVAMNEFTNPPVCTRRQSVAAGEAWVNRNDLTPVQ